MRQYHLVYVWRLYIIHIYNHLLPLKIKGLHAECWCFLYKIHFNVCIKPFEVDIVKVSPTMKLKRHKNRKGGPPRYNPRFTYSLSTSHILEHEFFCLGRFGSSGLKVLLSNFWGWFFQLFVGKKINTYILAQSRLPLKLKSWM